MARKNPINTIATEAVKPLYAVAGATEVAYGIARGAVADAQSLVSRAEKDPKVLQDQAVSVVNARVDELTKDAREAQGRFEARVAELQKDARALPGKVQAQIDEAIAELTKAYAELVQRGEKLVSAVRKDGYKAVSALRDAPGSSSVVRRERAKAAQAAKSGAKVDVSTSAKKAGANAPTTKSTAKKAGDTASAAKKTAAKKTSTAKTAAKKAPAKAAQKTTQKTAQAAEKTAATTQKAAASTQKAAASAQQSAAKTADDASK